MATITWSSLAVLPVRRQRSTANWVNGRFYTIGGWDEVQAYKKETYEYTPWNNTWTTKVAYPYAVQGFRDAGNVVIDDKIYVIGGNVDGSYTNRIAVYDPGTNSWSTLMNLPFTYGVGQVGVYQGDIYILGGLVNGVTSNLCYKVNVTTLVVTPLLSNKPTATIYGVCVLVGDSFYLPGGFNSGGVPFTQTEVYHVLSNTWSTVAAMPSPKWQHSAVGMDDIIYVMGGNAPNIPTNQIVEYNVLTNAWSVHANTLPYSSGSAMLTLFNGDVYIVGGRDPTNTAVNGHYFWNATPNTTHEATADLLCDSHLSAMPEKVIKVRNGNSNNGYNSAMYNQKMYNQGGVFQYSDIELISECDLSVSGLILKSGSTDLTVESDISAISNIILNGIIQMLVDSDLSSTSVVGKLGYATLSTIKVVMIVKSNYKANSSASVFGESELMGKIFILKWNLQPEPETSWSETEGNTQWNEINSLAPTWKGVIK